MHGPVAWLFVVRVPSPFCPTSWTPLRHTEITGKLFSGCKVFVDTNLEENSKGPYLIVPTTFDAGQERAFTMNLVRETAVLANHWNVWIFVKHMSFEPYWLWLQSTKQSGHSNHSLGREKRWTRQVERYLTGNWAISYHVVFFNLMWVTIRIRDNKVHKKQIPPKTTLH